MLTRCRRNHLFIEARNKYVMNRIMTYYTNHTQSRKVDVFCVSSWLFRDSRRFENEASRRRSLMNTDKANAAEQMRESSGIPQLRDFIQSIPQRAQTEEARHFLNTRIRTLLEKLELWFTGNMPGVSANQVASLHTVDTVQRELEEVSVTTS
jgi:hypothetical protein